MLRAVQEVEEKATKKEATAWGRRMGIVEYLISSGEMGASSASRGDHEAGWPCMHYPKSVADVFEALIGATFQDSGGDYVTAFDVRSHRCTFSFHGLPASRLSFRSLGHKCGAKFHEGSCLAKQLSVSPDSWDRTLGLEQT